MKEFQDNISDNDIRKLLQQRLLTKEDDVLLAAEEKLAYSLIPTVFPSTNMEKSFAKKSLLKKGIAKFIKKYIWKGLFAGTSAVVTITSAIYFYKHYNESKKQHVIESKPKNENHLTKDSVSTKFKTDFIPANKPVEYIETTEDISAQLVNSILMENADCTNPIYIRDSVLISKYAPSGTGNDMEIQGNAYNDSMYVEKEHNIVWYKFVTREESKLSFDIIPMNENDDYDFMLFQYNGTDFRSRLISKKIKPIRACISRSDKKMKGATGLVFDKNAPEFIHSGVGKSYVRSIPALKGQVYYLLVDAVKVNFKEGNKEGTGHTIRFHYRKYPSDEPYVGKRLYFNRFEFVAGSSRFKSWSGYTTAMDTIASFLKQNPNIKIEIQGHVNATEPQRKGDKRTPSQILSEERANAVFDCLVERGIDSVRMARVGYGASQKIILLPKTPKECIKNVRVEVVIRAIE